MSALGWPLAALGFTAHWLDAALRAPFRLVGASVPALWLLIGLLVVATAVPLWIEGSRNQPQVMTIDDISDGVSALTSRVRLHGQVRTLTPAEEMRPGRPVFSLLVEDDGDAILLRSQNPVDDRESITGELGETRNAARVVTTVAGEDALASVDLLDFHMIFVDREAVPERDVNWMLIWLPLGVAALLVVGIQSGYPVFRRSPRWSARRAAQLGAGETVRAAIVDDRDQRGARIRAEPVVLTRVSATDEPGGRALVLQRAGTSRRLTVASDRWVSVDVGDLWSLAGRRPAAVLQSWGVNVLLVFDSREDRDRTAAVVAPDARARHGSRRSVTPPSSDAARRQ